MAFKNSKVIVWERSNKLGKWYPYSSDICQFLEEKYRKNILNVCLGDADEALTIYSVNFKDMLQVSETTGTKSPIRRHLCDILSVLGRGFSWQWHDDDDSWNTYDADVNDFIDCAFLEGKKSVNLSKKFPGYSYEIVFPKMIQINKRSKRKRKVRRSVNASPYPIELDSDNVDKDSSANLPEEVKNVLCPDFLAQEVPGTADLVNQVNAYKRNVESPEHIEFTHVEKSDDCASDADTKLMEFSAENEEESIKASHSEQTSSGLSTAVALVNGKAWTEHRPPHTPQSKIKPVPGVDPLPKLPKVKRAKKKGSVKSCPEDPGSMLEEYTEIIDLSPDCNETCIICCEHLSSESTYGDKTVSKLTLCSHIFHKACIEAMYNSGNKEFIQCPTCKKIHGEKCGIQPPGEMIYHVLPYSLPGYPENDTIRIIYDFHPGIQGPEHPNPGKRYSTRGFPRHCYLPDSEMGRKILRLLIKAWKRRLIFTIGRSSTTGEENTVTWNEIHHKTEFGCNRYGHGYPDPNYFSNILAELESHGIIDDEVRVWCPV